MTTYTNRGAGDLALAILIGLIVGLIAAALLPTAQAQDSVVAPFDHSNCQYPDRWSNPPNGCDNSDPAAPECIKGMETKEAEEACIAALVAGQQPTTQTPPATTEQQPVTQCGAK